MAHKIDLREAPRDESGLIIPIEEGTSNVTLHDQNGNVTFHQIPNFTRDVKQQILMLLMVSPVMMTRFEIAKGLQLKKTPWLTAHIEQLVTDGYLTKTVTQWRNGVAMYYYGLPGKKS
jgi:hypothetical protein